MDFTHYRPGCHRRITPTSSAARGGTGARGIAAGAGVLSTIAGVPVSPGPQSLPPSRTTVRLEPRRATRRGGDRTPAPRDDTPVRPPLTGVSSCRATDRPGLPGD